jgi:peptidoglycan hydrolase-like protein with peptidoglycan-binding domain
MKYISAFLFLFALFFAAPLHAAVSYGGSSSGPTGYSTTGGGFVFPTQVITATSTQSILRASSSLQAPTFFFYSYLKPGSRGKEVSELQKRLIEEKYMTGPATGFFGRKTFDAVVLFQKENGINPIGFVGPLTRALLNTR